MKGLSIASGLVFLTLIGCSSPEVVENGPTQTEPEKEWVQTPTTNWGKNYNTELPNILVIGDSISIGITGPLSRALFDEYDVFHPADNCRNSYFTLHNLDRWLDMPRYAENLEIIVWNNGIWDSLFDDWDIGEDPREWFGVSIEEYEENIIQIAEKMEATGKRIIFFTTTEIVGGPFKKGMEIELNEIAKRVLPNYGIEIIDMYQIAIDERAEHPISYDVHFTDEGNEILADALKDFILNRGE